MGNIDPDVKVITDQLAFQIADLSDAFDALAVEVARIAEAVANPGPVDPGSVEPEPEPALTVRTSAELQAAYAALSSGAGGTIHIEPDGLWPLNLEGGGGAKVVVVSNGLFSGMSLIGVRNVEFRGLMVDGTDNAGIGRYQWQMLISQSHGVRLQGVTCMSNGVSMGALGKRGLMVVDCSTVAITECQFVGLEHGANFNRCDDAAFTRNEVTRIAFDGLRVQACHGFQAVGNNFYDFAAHPNEVGHSDFIQLFLTNSTRNTRDVLIEGNLMTTGNGSSVQAIWVSDTNGMAYEDVTIRNNLIYSASATGIGVATCTGLVVENNTLLWNPQAEVIKGGGNTSYPPRLRLTDPDNSTGVLRNNIASGATARTLQSALWGDNVLIDYTDPASPNYVDRHFVGALGGGDIGPQDWALRADSPWQAYGVQ